MINADTDKLIGQLNAPQRHQRLDALRSLQQKIAGGELPRPNVGIDINNHIHTTYSFSPYSPTKAVWMAYQAGLQTAGIMDHDSVAGAWEFIEAGKIIGMATTVGFEIRTSYDATPFRNNRLNNPDQPGNGYLLAHGLPHQMLSQAEAFLAPLRRVRIERLRDMAQNINKLVSPHGVEYDFERDSLSLSMAPDGGGTTERHLLFGLAHALQRRFGKGKALLAFLSDTLRLPIPSKIAALLLDEQNAFYDYDLLGALKSDFVERIYIPAGPAECLDMREVVAFIHSIGAIACYSYLGDVGDSVTGDKKAQTFEDAILDELMLFNSSQGLHALAYMPTRNTLEQLLRVRALCSRYQFFEICGEDINQPRQAFVCEILRRAEFSHLVEAAWALIGHETAASSNISCGFYGEQAKATYPELSERIAAYAAMGRGEKP